MTQRLDRRRSRGRFFQLDVFRVLIGLSGFALVLSACGSSPSSSTAESGHSGSPHPSVQATGGGATEGGASWSSGDRIDPIGFLLAVSCPASTACIAGGSNEYLYSNGSWSTQPALQGSHFQSISCPTAQFCAGVTSNGFSTSLLTYGGGTWSPVQPEPDTNTLASVSCASITFCMAIDAQDNTTYVYSNGVWTNGARTGASGSNFPTGQSLSCASSTFCVAVDQGFNDADVFDGSQWTTDQLTQSGVGKLTSVSCASIASCVVVTNGGYAFTLSNQTWTRTQVSQGANLAAVSCSSSSSCVAVGASSAYVLSNGSWIAHRGIDSGDGEGDAPSLTSVSCASFSFCVAVDVFGLAYTYS